MPDNDNHAALTRQDSAPARQSLDFWVHTPEFDQTCDRKAKERALASSNDSDWLNDARTLWPGSGNNTNAAIGETESHKVSEFEAYYYYFGIAPKGSHPRLIHRDSPDVFEEPTGPETYARQMRLVDVPGDHEFARNGLWEKVRDWVAGFLMKEGIKVSSVDFVKFTWLNKLEDRELESDDDEEDDETQEDRDEDVEAAFARLTAGRSGKPAENGMRHYSNATIWIGVTPDRLSGTRASELITQIRAYLDTLGLTSRVDIAFRESIVRSLLGNEPALYAPAETNDPLQGSIDNVSVALSLTISGRKTTMQGTLGPYFQHRGKLYAITCRHNLFVAEDDNEEYTYNPPAPKREVVLMGKPAFDSYVDSVQAHIGILNETVKTLKALIKTWSDRVNQGINLPTSQYRLDENQAELVKIERRIMDSKHFYVTLSTKWSKLSDRIIGHIAWSPPVAAGVGPNRFTQDVCVVELYKPKFLALIGNVLSLGPEISREAFTKLMYERNDVLSEFTYPDHGLLPLRGMLTANDVNSPNSLDTQDDRVRRVIKRGSATLTTVGTRSRFISFVRKYSVAGTLESLELAILPHESVTGTFCKGGDSGAIVVSPNGEYVGELTAGTSKGTEGSDITYATLFQYVWDVVLAKFPGANLYWDDIPAFLAAMAA